MKKLLVVLGAAALLAAVAPAGSSVARSCSDLSGRGSSGGHDIEARGLSCWEAKQVVRAFTDGPAKRVFAIGWNFRCRIKRTGYETYRTRCGARIGSTSFTWGF